MRKIKEWETASGQRAKNNGIERRNKENVHVQRYCPQENNNNKNHKTAVVGRGKIWRSSRSLSHLEKSLTWLGSVCAESSSTLLGCGYNC